jgi:Rrf2 family protein
MLSSRTKYGIHSLIYLAHRFGRGFIAIKEISEAERIPKKFLEAILLDLKGAGILISRAGPNGGYSLRLPPEQLTVGRVVRVLEGPLALTPCVSQNNYSPCSDCRSEAECSIKLVMKQVRDATAEIMDQVTFRTLATDEEKLKEPGLTHFFEI